MSKVTRTWSGPSMHAIAGMFYARASVTPKRVLRSLRTQKVLTTVRQIERATPGAPRTARPSKCAISQSKHEPEAACPYTPPQKSSAHVIWSRPKTRPGIFFSFCSHMVFAMAPYISAPGAPPTARLAKCTILSDTRALSGPAMHHTTAEVPLMPLGHERVLGTLLIA